MSNQASNSPRSTPSNSPRLSREEEKRIREINLQYRSKQERISCLWERHEARKNIKSEGKVIEWTFNRREPYIKGWTDNCFYCLDRTTTCRNHQVKLNKRQLKELMASDQEVLLP